ncbi:site-specific tyrosine recombinase XerC [Chromobacterium violaceum]|uniref:Site-specific tyrosine recombinase XerC n=1 Tax=Chromobacterium violaceum TaxID=536 RepID=A0A3S4HML5_CHRVL|nr:site-specific tyrosine recombinase XerC [Chromobacterium violaceum]
MFGRAQAAAPNEEIRAKLRAASTHWLRHTAASHQLEAGVPLLLVSQNLRHASIQTTRRYLHSEEDARHEASRLHKLKRDS